MGPQYYWPKHIAKKKNSRGSVPQPPFSWGRYPGTPMSPLTYNLRHLDTPTHIHMMLVVEPNLPNPEILFSCDCNTGVLYTRSPYLGVQGSAPKKGVWGQRRRDTGVWGQRPQENGGSRDLPLNLFFLGCVLANSIVDPWYWVNPRIFPLYFPYKRKHCKLTVYGIVLYWKRDCESM